MQTFAATVLGATGLIGQQLVRQLLADPGFSKVTILVRRKADLSHPKLLVSVVDFDDLADYCRKLSLGDCIFCCIGTTQKKVKGDKIAYRKIDLDIPVNAAKMGRDAGFTKYLLVSAVGADERSKNFYLGLKGKVEKEIAAQHFDAFHAFRPGILYGDRKEPRLGETIGKAAMKAVSGLLSGSYQKYRGIDAKDVAKAMAVAAKSGSKGMFIHHYADMMNTSSDG